MGSAVPTVVSAISVAVAVAALGYSVLQMRRQNLLPVALDLFREARAPEWFTARDWIVGHLAGDCLPDAGISGLPEPARAHVRKIGFFYDNLGIFVAYRVVNQDLVLGFFGAGMNEIWEILHPYIRREEQIRGIRYMVYFNDLVYRFRKMDMADIYRQQGLRQLQEDPGRQTG